MEKILEESNLDISREKRQEDKLIAFLQSVLMTGKLSSELVQKKEVNIGLSEKNNVSEALRDDKISDEQIEIILGRISLPVSTKDIISGEQPKEDYSGVFTDFLEFVRISNDAEGNDKGNTIVDDVRFMLDKYTSPYKLFEKIDLFTVHLDYLRNSGGAEYDKKELINNIMKELHKIYGKRFEYAEIIIKLKKEVKKPSVE